MPTPFSRSSSTSTSSDAAHRLVASRCPECGAPVDFRTVPPDQAQVKCAYCGTLIAIPGRSPKRDTTATVIIGNEQQTTQGGWGCGAALTASVILIVVLGMIGGWSMSMLNTAVRVVSEVVQDDSANDLPGLQGFSLPTVSLPGQVPRLASAPFLLAGNDRSATQLVVAAYQNDGSLFIGFDTLKRKETWRSPELSERYYEMGVGADGERVYIADGATLLALERENGQLLWQASLANKIQANCNVDHPCLQLAGAQLITLARDGTVQGFAGATGAPLWSRRLNSQPRQFIVSREQVLLVDNDDSNRAMVWVLNAANGDVIHELRPSCTFPNIEMRPHSSDQYVVTPDGAALLVVSSGTYACAWRYSLDDGALTWHYTPATASSPLPFAWSMSSLTVADPMIYFVKDEGDEAQIYALDSQTAGAQPQRLYSIDAYEITVQYPVGDLLVVSAIADYARDEVEIWAIDRATGERRWQRRLETEHSFDKWVTHPSDAGLFLAVCAWNKNDCRFEVLDLATGTSQGQTREAIGPGFGGTAWRGNQGFLTLNGKIYALDLRTATIQYSWP